MFAIATARNKGDVQYNGKVDVWAAGVIYYIVSRFFVCAPTIAHSQCHDVGRVYQNDNLQTNRVAD